MYNKYLLIPIANLIYKFSTFQYIISQFYGQNIGISYRQYYKMCIGNKNFTFFMGIFGRYSQYTDSRYDYQCNTT